jgi:hypothetical protein
LILGPNDVPEFVVELCPGEIEAHISLDNVSDAVIRGAGRDTSFVRQYDGLNFLIGGRLGATRVSDLSARGFASEVDCSSGETGDDHCYGLIGGAAMLGSAQVEMTNVSVVESVVERGPVLFSSETVVLTDVAFHRNKANEWGAALAIWVETDFTAYNLDLGSGSDDNTPAETELAICHAPEDDGYPELIAAYSFDEPVDLHCYGGTCEVI